jgi:amidase
MARTVADVAAALPVVAGPDWSDATVHDVPLRDAARALEAGGAVVEEAIPPAMEQAFDIFLGIATADGGEGVRFVLRSAGTKKMHPLLERFLEMAQPMPAAHLQNLWAQVTLYRSATISFLKRYDVVLCPVNALPAMEHGTSADPEVLPSFSYTMAHNLTGWPAAVVRCGTSREGLPVGVQVVAMPWREDVALAVAAHLESALGGYQRPGPAAGA